MKKSLFGILCITILMQLWAPQFVLAQTPTVRLNRTASPTPIRPQEQPTVGINLTLSPVFLNLSTEPGKNVTSSIKVTNNNNITEYLRLSLSTFRPDPNTGNPTIADIERGDEFVNWVRFSEDEFVLAPRETKTISVTITPPQTASLGYYYAVLVSRINEAAPGERQAIVAGSPAVPLLLDVRTANAKREIQLVDFKTDQMIYEYLPTTFAIKMKNTGNVHLAPAGDMFIDWGGKENIGIVPVNKGRGNILPNYERVYTASWEDGFPLRVPKMENGQQVKDQNGKAVYETKYDLSQADKFRIGKYTARVIMVYDNGERDVPIEAKVSFWIIPWKILLVGLVIILFLVLGIRSVLSGIFRKR